MKKIVLLVWLSVASSFATTYDIDYNLGLDSNNGTSQATPWKRAPGMTGFTGTYTPHAGDRFIFKGGVTWPASCFPMTINNGGTHVLPFVEDNPTGYNYYGGGDPSWFTGGSWSRPIFDFTGGSYSAQVITLAATATQLDNVELKNLRGTHNNILVYLLGSYTMMTNCLLHDWQSSLYPDAAAIYASNPPFGNVVTNGTPDDAPYAVWGADGIFGIEIHYCEFHQQGVLQKNGASTHNITYVSHCHFHHTCQAIPTGAGIWHDNLVHDIYVTDGNTHSNCFQSLGQSQTLYNNLAYNLSNNTSPMSMNGLTCLVYNNVFYDTGGQALGMDTRNNGFATSQEMYNNTFVRCASAGVGNNVQTAKIQNNHYIDTPMTVGTGVGSLTQDHNLVQTTNNATLAGYTAGNAYRPTSGSAPTVNVGVDLSAKFTIDRLNNTRSAPWDIGAYEWNGIAPTPTATPSATATPPPTPTPSPTPTPTLTTLPLQNRDFETSPYSVRGTIPGWSIGGPGHIMAQNEGYTSASHAATFNEGGDFNGDTLSQSFVATPGQMYTLTFKSGIFGIHTGSAQRLNATVTGTTQNLNQTVTPPEAGTNTPASVTFQTFTFTFTADNAVETLKFTDLDLGNGSADLILDDVDVTTPDASPFLIQFYP